MFSPSKGLRHLDRIDKVGLVTDSPLDLGAGQFDLLDWPRYCNMPSGEDAGVRIFVATQ